MGGYEKGINRMTISTANTSLKLDSHKAKKYTTEAVGAQVMGVDDVLVWAGGNINPGLTQSIIGGFEALHAYGLTAVHSGLLDGGALDVGRVHMPLGGGSADVLVNGIPGAGDLTIEYGADIIAKRQTHFMDRTFKRLREMWLES